MTNLTIVGAQWGDEGKGKIVDWLASKVDTVVRFQGGNNAGHTIQIADKIFNWFDVASINSITHLLDNFTQPKKVKDKTLNIEFMDLGGSFIGNLKYENIVSYSNSLTCVYDLCKAIEHFCVHRDTLPQGIYNIVNNGAVTGAQVIDMI